MKILLAVFGAIASLIAAIFVADKSIPFAKKYVKKYIAINKNSEHDE